MDGSIVIGTEIDTTGFDKEINLLEDKLNDVKASLQMASEDKTLFSTREIKEMEAEAEKLGRRIDNLKGKQRKIDSAGFIGMKESVENVGKSVQKVTKKIVGWGIALFGIRTAFGFIRGAMNTIAGGDAQLKADIDYMKNALAYAIEPVVRAIVNLAKQLLFYIGYIVKAWFGINIFENANKSLKDSNKQAKELKKTMAGFDEMNVVGGGQQVTATETTAPSFNLSNLEDIDAPGWLKWLGKNGKTVASILSGIATALLLIKLGVSGIKAFGIGVLIEGIVYTLKSLIDYMNDPSWENFGDVLAGIGIVVAGLAVIFGSLPLAIAAAIIVIVALIAKFWDKIKEFLDNLVSNIFKLGEDIKKWLHDHLGILGDMIGVVVDTIIGVLTGAITFITNLLDGVFKTVKDIFDGIIKIFQGDFVEGIKSIGKGLINAIITGLNAFIDAINLIVTPLRAIIVGIGWILNKGWSMEDIKIPNIPYLAQGGIVNNPGPGVMMGNFVAGEKGPEAVIPLDDATLDRLGLSFAKHTVINATIVNEMNGRVLSRELKKINAEDQFAYNS